MRCSERPAVDPLPPLLSVSCKSVRKARSAGARPHTTPVSRAISAVNASTVLSIPTSSRRGKLFAGSDAISPRIPQLAITVASTAPASESSRLSTSDCRITRQRLDPSASRTAVSFILPLARTSIRFATLLQAIRSTNPTVPNKTSSVGRMLETTCSRSGTTWAVMPAFVAGYSAASLLQITSISAWACASGTPSRSRAKIRNERPPRSFKRLSNNSGTHTSTFVAQNGAKWNDSGITPFTV